MPTPSSEPGRDRAATAVGYLRRSTDRQERSLDDQRSAIERHAREHGLQLVEFYVDDAVSGTRSETRAAFQRLIHDAQQPTCPFGLVLVYDVKRFGRVDNDEAGHYRWVLRQHGVSVVYVAEGFAGGPLDDLIRPVKQWQARQESRDLSRVTVRGMLSKARANLPLGIWLGGFPPHGYDLLCESAEGEFRFVVRYMRDGTKQLLDCSGQHLATLARREPYVVRKTDRCRLTPSSPERVQVVRRIYEDYVEKRLKPSQITRQLNADGVATARSPEWSAKCTGRWHTTTIENILRNPAYAGDLAWNRRTLAKFFRISPDGPVKRSESPLRRAVQLPEDDWVVVRDCHPPLVSREMWMRARAARVAPSFPHGQMDIGVGSD
jgi:site-specific DNA recombinase